MIIRRLTIGLALLLTIGGCSDEPEPVPVAEDFSATVTSLLRSVDEGAEPSFGAESCGAWPSTPDQIITWADASLTGVSAAELRTAAVAAGWQPQIVDGVDLALVGPHGVLLALTGQTVRAERPNCTKSGDSRKLDQNDFTIPDPTDAQTRNAADGQTRAKEVAEGVMAAIGRTSTSATEPRLFNCGDAGPQGVTWTLRRVDKLPASPDPSDLLARVTDELAQDWTVETTTQGPNEVLTAASRGGALSLQVTIRRSTNKDGPNPLTLEIQPAECLPVTGS